MKATARVSLALFACLLTGCSTSTEQTGEPRPTVTETRAPVEPQVAQTSDPEPEEAAISGCEVVPTELLAKVQAGAEDGTGMIVTRGVAYRSPDFENVYFVAAEFTATGVDPQVGVWAMNSLDPSSGIVMAVDGLAQQFTVWPDGDVTDAAISKADPSVAVALECLG